jgi:penicillin-binding protein 1A
MPDGLGVRTSLDSRLQKAANEALARQLAADCRRCRRRAETGGSVLQGGFHGAGSAQWSRARWVGSRDFAQGSSTMRSQAHVANPAPRSSPVYGAAFMQLKPETTLIDQPVAIRRRQRRVDAARLPRLPACPTLRDGLRVSKNTITAQ